MTSASRSNAARLRNRAELEAMIEERLGRDTRAEVLERLDQAGIANGAVNDVAEVAGHAQLAARGRWVSVDSPAGPIPALLPPHNLQHAPAVLGGVPALGQHTREILAELGFEESFEEN